MKNMKRQAVGVRRSSDELENGETSDRESKRIKLLSSDSESGNVQVDGKEDKSMDLSPIDNSGSNHNHEDNIMPVLIQNGSDESNISNSSPDHLTQPNELAAPHVIENGPIDKLETNHKDNDKMVNNNQNIDEMVNINQNSTKLMNNNENGDEIISNQNSHQLLNNLSGSRDEVVLKNSSTYSGIVSELYYSDSQSSTVLNSEKELSEEKKSMPVLLNDRNIDINNGESIDSLQSEGFEVLKSSDSEKKSELCSSQDQDKSPKIISNSKSNVLKSFDVDNLTLSHLEVTQLEGHPDVIFSVAADEDFVLSSSGDTTVKVWSMENQNLICNFSGHSDSVTSVLLLSQFQSDILKKKLHLPKEISRIAITGSLDCHVKLWSVFEGKELFSVYTFNGITCLGYLESESLVVVGTEGGKLELWDICTSKAKQSVRAHDDTVSDIKVNDCNIYSVSSDGTVKVWLFEDEEIYPVYTRKRKERMLKGKELSPTQWKAVTTSDNIMYLGDSTNCVKVLDSTAGRLRLFRNQEEEVGICECVASEKELLLTSFYDSSSDTGGVNVWRIPEMTYVCTLSGEIQDINSLAIVQQAKGLRIVTGGHQLLVWDFDFSRPPNKESQTSFQVIELESVGQEISEKSVEVKNADVAKKSVASHSCENNNKWCNVM